MPQLYSTSNTNG